MKITTYKKILIILIAFGSYLAGNSQQYPDSLITYLEITAKNNPWVLQKFSEYQAALQKIPQVGSLSDPELSMGVFLSPMELVSGNQIADIRLMQMFPWFGVLKSARDEMSLMANAKFEVLRDAKLQIFYDVQRTWYELYKVQKDISISEKNIEILKVIERLALVRFKSGTSVNTGTASSSPIMTSGSIQNNNSGSSGMSDMVASQNNTYSSALNQTASSMQPGSMGSSPVNSGLTDLYRIQMEVGEIENRIASLKNQRNSTMARFNSYLNRPVISPVFTPETVVPDSLDLSLIAVSDSMLLNNPMLDMLEFEKQSLEARKKMVSHMGYPMVGFGVDYSLINKNVMSTSPMNGKDMIMPMITVTLPIYRKKYRAMETEAELLKAATSQNFQATSNSLQTEYYEAVQLFQDARRRIILYDNQYQLSSKSLDLMLKSFAVSTTELSDVLRMSQQNLDYELKKVEAIADFNTAIAWLKRLMAVSQIQ